MNEDSRALISIIIPVRNEEDAIPILLQRLTEVFRQIDVSVEFVFVNDGSTDRTFQLIEERRKNDPRIACVDLSRGFGKEIALTAGLEYSKGDAVVLIDADLQDPPELILEMAKKWKEGYEVVFAVRTEREGESWFKLWTASLFYRIIYRITNV